MSLLLKLLGFAFDNPLARLGGAALLLSGLVAAFVHDQRRVGEMRAQIEIETRTHAATKQATDRGGRAARGSRDERVRGQRDPWTRDD